MSERVPSTGLTPATPFLKWAGGKGGLLTQYTRYFPDFSDVQRYVEPFVGGGAVFFRLQRPQSRLADLNPAVIECYRTVRDRLDDLVAALREIDRNEEDHFYRIRDLDPAELDEVHRVARFIYLNRTCYNGLYRVNRQGRFNVPFGKYKNPTICDEPGLRACREALQGVDLRVGDFAAVTADLGEGDFVYFDPPYVPMSRTANFTDYSAEGFGEPEQRRLAETFHRLDQRGCKLMLSNSTAPLVGELYEGHGYPFREIKARRAINSDPSRRGPISEVLIVNYPCGGRQYRF